MEFAPIDFAKLNESDVREEIIAPLLRCLGYRSGTTSNIIREQSLRYPRIFIGRKKEGKDPPLRGTADYILEVNGIVRWVIEAKGPDVEIGLDEVEQAYTYANHPEVRAVYFVIVNGRQLHIFQTNQGPDAKSLLTLKYEELDGSLLTLKNILSPESLLRDHPPKKVDVNPPIGPGLRSIVRITSGHITYKSNSLNLPTLNGLIVGIVSGAVERDEQGHLVAYLKTQSPFQAHQKLNERLGIGQFEAVSNDTVISTDEKSPTAFSSNRRVVFPRGEKVLDLLTWKEIELPMNMTCDIEATATGILLDDKFVGRFMARVNFLEVKIDLRNEGEFEIHVA